VRNLSLGRIAEFALIVGILALGRPVLLPVALAFYLAFVLTPPSDWLERIGLPRPLSVVSVVVAALAALAVLSSVLVAQAADLARQMKTYSLQMSQKLSGIRSGKLRVLADLSNAMTDLGRGLDPELSQSDQTTPVRVVSGGLSVFQRLEQAVGPLLEPVALVIIVLVMTVFVLAHREDLRGRLIQLVGPQNVTLTTRTMDEAVKRVSHFLLTQAYINAGFGVVVAVGLYFIGIPYAALWGAIAGLLRFVPLLGILIATLLPALVAFAIFPGWRETLMTVGLCLTVDTVVANFIEPLVLGKRTGVSALALLISALFWTWLWGPFGLVLATPLTVCAAVMGRHVPELSFLAIALGDEPGLNQEVNFYQRILARATKDAQRIAKRRAAETSLPQTFDELLIPALRLMVRDRNGRAINQSVADRVVSDVDDIVTRLNTAAAPRQNAPALPPIVGIAAESGADRLLLKMLERSLEEQSKTLLVLQETDRSGAVAEAIRRGPGVVCIAALPPSGNVNARFLCRRLRAELPGAYILVLHPEASANRSPEAAARLREAGANSVAVSLREAASSLAGRSPAA
jgi:predicted PurR-regulated permease PerM